MSLLKLSFSLIYSIGYVDLIELKYSLVAFKSNLLFFFNMSFAFL